MTTFVLALEMAARSLLVDNRYNSNYRDRHWQRGRRRRYSQVSGLEFNDHPGCVTDSCGSTSLS